MSGYDHLRDDWTKGKKFVVREDGGEPYVYRHYARPNGNVGTYKKVCGPFASIDVAKDFASMWERAA